MCQLLLSLIFYGSIMIIVGVADDQKSIKCWSGPLNTKLDNESLDKNISVVNRGRGKSVIAPELHGLNKMDCKWSGSTSCMATYSSITETLVASCASPQVMFACGTGSNWAGIITRNCCCSTEYCNDKVFLEQCKNQALGNSAYSKHHEVPSVLTLFMLFATTIILLNIASILE